VGLSVGLDPGAVAGDAPPPLLAGAVRAAVEPCSEYRPTIFRRVFSPLVASPTDNGTVRWAGRGPQCEAARVARARRKLLSRLP